MSHKKTVVQLSKYTRPMCTCDTYPSLHALHIGAYLGVRWNLLIYY